MMNVYNDITPGEKFYYKTRQCTWVSIDTQRMQTHGIKCAIVAISSINVSVPIVELTRIAS